MTIEQLDRRVQDLEVLLNTIIKFDKVAELPKDATNQLIILKINEVIRNLKMNLR
ncbi:MAG: hypothetical protein JHC33_12620 [Ignisphaera sp.]|nr:hypothetical protein [Ignisphaera sp.]